MKVHLSFDVEVWCDGWQGLDDKFPAAFDRYVYGRSARGQFALPETLAILKRHGLKGVFFVEPLFAARFGERYLAEIVSLIEAAGQEVQLHLHPEWTDEIVPAPLVDVSRKRQHLSYYTESEQLQLLKLGLGLLRRYAKAEIYAFRAGSYAANANTYRALHAAGIGVDSSLNRIFEVSGADLPERSDGRSNFSIGGVQVYPVTVFRDGLGRLRPAQVGACGALELECALESARAAGHEHFVVVSHNFELLKPGKAEPDLLVVRRFEAMCRYLASHPDRYKVGSFPRISNSAQVVEVPTVGRLATLIRIGEQAVRRFG